MSIVLPFAAEVKSTLFTTEGLREELFTLPDIAMTTASVTDRVSAVYTASQDVVADLTNFHKKPLPV